MKLNKSILEKHEACREGKEWYMANGEPKTVESTIAILIKSKESEKYNWSNWLLSEMLSKKNKIRYAVFAAQQVLDLFEKKYPDDKRPRAAIEAANICVEKNTKKNRAAAYAAADAAAYAAARAAADAAYAAYAAAAAARAAADAANAAYAAEAAADAAAAAAYAAADAARAADYAARAAARAAYAAAYAAYAAAYAAEAAARAAMLLKIINYGLSLIGGKNA